MTNCLGLQKFLPQLNPLWFLQPEVVGTYLPGTGTLGWGAWCVFETPCSRDIPPEFYPAHLCVGPAYCGSGPDSTSLDGCGFFNSVVVRLPFSFISDVPQWWLFYVLVVILMWLWQEESHVCLRCHLDQKWSVCFIIPYCPLSISHWNMPIILGIFLPKIIRHGSPPSIFKIFTIYQGTQNPNKSNKMYFGSCNIPGTHGMKGRKAGNESHIGQSGEPSLVLAQLLKVRLK